MEGVSQIKFRFKVTPSLEHQASYVSQENIVTVIVKAKNMLHINKKWFV